jgi:nucleoid DNA-binding protein
MTKRDIALKIYDKLSEKGEPQLTRREIHEIVRDTFKIIKDKLNSHEKVQLSGFGTFLVRHRKGKIGRNLRTGEVIQVPDRYVVFFKPSQNLLQKLNNNRK